MNTYRSVDSKGTYGGTRNRVSWPVFGYEACFPSRLWSRQKAGAPDSHKKENAATWLPQRRLYLVVPEMIIAKFGLGSREKKIGK
jgi:hypothetical protein